MSSHRTCSVSQFSFAVIVLCLFLIGSAFAQRSGKTPAPATSTPGEGTEGKQIGEYHVTQSVELGGRFNDTTGSHAMYNTMVNYQSGPRILEQSLTMQSTTRTGIFDSLTATSFGWGGDPEQAARVRISKYGWYNFFGSYQHMQNYFDDDLLANPLNPPTGSPFVPILNSPHAYYNRHNLYNFGLVVAPMHRVSFRADYSRNRFIGPSLSSRHDGTDTLLDQDTNNTLNGFRFGLDLHVYQRTIFSYTQSLQYYSGGTLFGLNRFNSWPLPNGQQVTFGLPWFNGGSPCSAPLNNGVANPVCNGSLDYTLFQHVSTFIPTEQVNFKSTSLKWLDFNGQYQYSHARMNTPYDSVFDGLITRSSLRGFDTTGSHSHANWNSASADISAVFKLKEKLRLVEAFRFRNFSVAGNFVDLESSFYAAAGGGSTSLLSPIATFPASILAHGSSAPADIINELNANLTAQNWKQNDFQVQYDITHLFGLRAGFVWQNLDIQPGSSYSTALGDLYYPNNPNRGNCAGLPLNPDGSCTFVGVIEPFGNQRTEINRYSGVVGAWFRKGKALHADVDVQYGGADNWIYRIDPITALNIRGNVRYAPRPWLTLGSNLIFQRARNNNSDLAYNQHNYSASFNATITPSQRWGLDLAYNIDAIQQNMNICYEGDVTAPGSFACVGAPGDLLEVYNHYQTHTHYGYFAFTATPLERLTLRAGYSVVDNDGGTTSLNSLQPLGPLNSRYQTPLAGADFQIRKDVIFKATWNYYQYAEGSFVGPTAPRYFHANNTTLALRYAF